MFETAETPSGAVAAPVVKTQLGQPLPRGGNYQNSCFKMKQRIEHRGRKGPLFFFFGSQPLRPPTRFEHRRGAMGGLFCTMAAQNGLQCNAAATER